MDMPELVTAVTPEAVPGEQQMHYVQAADGVALCGMTGLLTDDGSPESWWLMSEKRAFEGMYAGCVPCHRRHSELVEQWVDAKWPGRYKAPSLS